MSDSYSKFFAWVEICCQWDEVIQEVIRRANAVVAVVSAQNLHTWSYAPIATLISRTTAVPVSAVVLTKIDTIRKKDIPTEDLQRAFWTSGKHSHEKSGLLLPCSTLVSTGSAAVLALVKQQGAKPPFEVLENMPFFGVSARLNFRLV